MNNVVGTVQPQLQQKFEASQAQEHASKEAHSDGGEPEIGPDVCILAVPMYDHYPSDSGEREDTDSGSGDRSAGNVEMDEMLVQQI